MPDKCEKCGRPREDRTFMFEVDDLDEDTAYDLAGSIGDEWIIKVHGTGGTVTARVLILESDVDGPKGGR